MRSLLLFLPFMFTNGTVVHHFDPIEDNVFSNIPKPPCQTNEFGFGGNGGLANEDNVLRISYDYEVETKAYEGYDIDNVIFSLEQSIANYLLNTDTFANACDRRKLVVDVIGGRTRKLVTVPTAVSITPADTILDGFICKNDWLDGNNCSVVSGEMKVYIVGNPDDSDEFEQEVKGEIKDAMDAGEFNDAHDAIERVTWVEDLDAYVPSGDAVNEQQDGAQAPTQGVEASGKAVIIGTSIGAIVLLGAIAFYRRRQVGSLDDETHTHFPGGSAEI